MAGHCALQPIDDGRWCVVWEYPDAAVAFVAATWGQALAAVPAGWSVLIDPTPL